MHSSKRFGHAARRTGAVVVLAALLGGSNVVLAQQPAPRLPVPPPAIPPATQLFLSDIYPGVTLDGFLQNLRTGFFMIDADIDGKLTQSDLDFHTRIDASHKRASAVNFVMSLDLDGDGAVTEDEIRRAFRYNNRMELGRAAFNTARKLPTPGVDGREKLIEDDVRTIMALDADKDGRVVPAEASKYSQPGWPLSGRGVLPERTRLALMLATGSTREITMADYQAAAVALFNKIDSDGNGIISEQESIDYRQRPDTPEGAARIAAAEMVQKRQREEDEAVRKKQQEAQAARAGCTMPKASEKAKVIIFSVSETEALSSVALGSQDTVIHAGRVVVEPGPEPLYMIIPTSSATIWQFSGAVERIERLVMSSSLTGPNDNDPQKPPLVGATGIASDRLNFFSRSDCVRYFDNNPSSASVETVTAVRNATGKEPIVMAKRSVSAIVVPSGKIGTLKDDRPQPLIIQKSQGSLNIIGDSSNVIIQAGPSRARDELYWYFPGGVTDIDPKAVIANVPVAAYEVLPSAAGLAQLVASGALTQNGSGEYVVHRKIRFPAGLYGAHSVTFVVRKGLPLPDGDQAHSCVIVEETGESKGAACRSR
jgi:hypothetical protein